MSRLSCGKAYVLTARDRITRSCSSFSLQLFAKPYAGAPARQPTPRFFGGTTAHIEQQVDSSYIAVDSFKYEAVYRPFATQTWCSYFIGLKAPHIVSSPPPPQYRRRHGPPQEAAQSKEASGEEEACKYHAGGSQRGLVGPSKGGCACYVYCKYPQFEVCYGVS